MNYWPRYVGDIQRKTGHLTLAEMGAYDRLLDHIYANEAPLPGDIEACCRIARAMTKSERQAVDSVLQQFFDLDGSGYVNRRATEEIEKDRPRREAAKANGIKGGRPRASSKEPSGLPDGLPAGTQGEPRAKAPQPQPQHKTPPPPSGVGTPETKTPRAAKRAPAGFAVDAAMQQWAAEHAPGIDIDAETARFKDHTYGTARSDWPATWRNWIREAVQRAAKRPPARSGAAQEPEWRREKREHMAAFAGPFADKPRQADIIDLETHHAAPRLVG